MFEREFVEPGVMEIRHFREDLCHTLGGPERMAGLERDRVEPFTDAIGSLSLWYYFSDKYKADQARYAAERDDEDVPDLVVLPSLLWRTWRNNRRSAWPAQGDARDAVHSFREWLFGDLETWQGRLKGRDAAVAILLPIAAVAIGMTAFAIVLHFTSGG